MRINYEIEITDDDAIILNEIKSASFGINLPAHESRRLEYSNYKTNKIIRELYGIIGCREKTTQYNLKKDGYYIPEQNRDAVENAVNVEHVFRKSIDSSEIPVLEFIYERTNILKEKYNKRWTPRFSPTEVSKNLSIPKKVTRNVMMNLTGILTERKQAGYQIYEDNLDVKKDKCITLVVPFWSIYNSRISLVEKLIKL